MLFTQIEFIILLLLIMGFFLFINKNALKKTFLLVASYYFYAYWDYRFLGLIILPTVVDYAVALLMERSCETSRRKVLLFVSLAVNLGILWSFKYYNFFVASLQHLLQPVGINLVTLNIILPLGVSFYTFKTLSYVIDVYRGRLRACRSFVDYALFVSFFPTLLAGPIIRATHFLPQLETNIKLSRDNIVMGSRRFVIGLFKKVFIADRLSLFIDPFFANAGAFDCATTWLAVVAFTIQLYLDFSGYSDMSIGVARMLGYDLEENFSLPYLSTNVIAFWRRWHMTLSSWIRDYVYIPLGGSRKGSTRTYANIVLSMGLCGLWHGAAWTYVFWGFYHGLALTVNHGLRKMMEGREEPAIKDLRGMVLIKWFVTMLVILSGWVLFRSADFDQAMMILLGMFSFKTGIAWYHPFVISSCIAVALYHVVEACSFTSVHRLPTTAWYTPGVLFCMLWLVILFHPAGFTPFIYVRF